MMILLDYSLKVSAYKHCCLCAIVGISSVCRTSDGMRQRDLAEIILHDNSFFIVLEYLLLNKFIISPSRYCF